MIENEIGGPLSKNFNLGKVVSDTIEFINERVKLRHLVDFFMDAYMNLFPETMMEKAMEFGKHALDELIYNIKF